MVAMHGAVNDGGLAVAVTPMPAAIG